MYYIALLVLTSNLNTTRKNPSVLFLPLKRKWPTLVLGLGYGESCDELVTGTDILLEGSRGRIGYAIVVGYNAWLLVMKKSKKDMWSCTSIIKILGKETGLEKDK